MQERFIDPVGAVKRTTDSRQLKANKPLCSLHKENSRRISYKF